MYTLTPPRLRPGDGIGFYSPSAAATAFAPQRFARAKAYLQSHGFRLIAGSLTGKRRGYRSGTIQERVAELNALIRDPEVRCIMSTIGGMNSNSLLPYLDYEALRRDPKIIIGYSDVTAILLGIYAQTGLVTFYGPALVASFGEFPPLVDMTYQSFAELLLHPALPHTYRRPPVWSDEFIEWETQTGAKPTHPNDWITVIPGRAEGRLIGGNLNTIIGSIWGSKYMPPIREGDILFIEDSMKDAASQEREFAFLKANHVFDKVGAIVMGKHERFDDQGTGVRPHEILLEVLHGQEIPFLAEFDCGHTHPMFTLPLGVTATVDATEQTVTLTEGWWQRD